ncbi:MAG TPA: tRNA (guanosine(37)-N1)-methyltransferase TrmD [Thermomicrobiaceae bacterium]|nr:tRNA (guanosine(37)-N1)-methyltransferase TrmD [Thermomicrobiaceae bacterium]
MRFDVFTIFPGAFEGPLTESILKRAQENGLMDVRLHDIREWSLDRHHSVDDYPYGGGPGMVMMAPPIVSSVEAVLGEEIGRTPVIALSPAGELLTQAKARALSGVPRLALICGRYEGIDERVHQILRTEEISIGDYVLTGGELAAAVLIDVVARLIPGVIDAESTEDESHGDGLLEYPQYTRPPVVRDIPVPEVLLSGHHGKVAQWRRQQSLLRTRSRRPDLFGRLSLSAPERRWLESLDET